MLEIQNKIQEFHRAVGAKIRSYPTLIPVDESNHRLDLIREETDELEAAFAAGNLVEIADAIGDLLYVVGGTAVQSGIDAEPVFNEVHRSNMTKVGGGKRVDGKILKPDSYSPPNLKPIIDGQVNSYLSWEAAGQLTSHQSCTVCVTRGEIENGNSAKQ